MTTKDGLTVLTSAGPVLTKTWRADGTIESYGRAKNFRFESVPVSNIHDLAAVLRELGQQPTRCVIRGEPRGGMVLDENGRVQRTLQNFMDVPRRWLMLDVDGWDAAAHGLDPVAEPGRAVRAFIREALPVEFHGVSCFWQLSSSAGAPGKGGILKAHLWFWLDRPIGGEVLERWAMALRLPADSTVFRTVQVHYVAAPVIEPGASCPVTQRSGMIEGVLDDEVALVIPENLTLPPASRPGRTELFDPTEHRGLRGAFNRCYPPARCVDELLAGVVEWETDDSSNRLTWLRSNSGALGGMVITDDGLHIYNSHAGDPAEGRAVDAWTFCRHHLFDGDHEEMKVFAEGLEEVVADVRTAADDFDDLVDDDEQKVPHPSNASGSSRREEARNERLDRLESYRQRIRDAKDVEALKEIGGSIGADESIDDVERRGLFVPDIQKRWKQLTQGGRLLNQDARKIVGLGGGGAGRGDGGGGGAPAPAAVAWLDRWVRLTDERVFWNLDRRQGYSTEDFDYHCSDRVPPGQNGERPFASVWLRRNGILMNEARRAVYAPGEPEIFESDGHRFANLWSADTAPAAADEPGLAAELFEAHLRRIFPDDRERGILISWMAHQVRKPGVQVQWAPYIYGVDGSGKTMIHEVLEHAIGDANVKTAGISSMKSDFNAWATGAQVVVIEEIFQVGHALEVVEKLKAPLTNKKIELHRKGKDAYTIRNYCNYLILSNYKDALPINDNDRRYFFLRTNMTKEEQRALKKAKYFKRIYDAMDAAGAAGGLRRWLLDHPGHPEFEVGGAAPETKAREEVLDAVRSDAEKILRHAIGDGKAFYIEWATELLRKSDVDVPKGRGWGHMAERMGFLSGSHIVKTGGRVLRVIRTEEAATWAPADLVKEANRVRARFIDSQWDDEDAAVVAG